MKLSIKPLSVVLLSIGCVAQTAFGAVYIPTVYVGDPGNANDSTGYGSVSTGYKIATYETSISVYTAFLNAVAATDTYSLYNNSMASDANIAGIARSGSSGSYAYSVIGDGSRPVAYVNWFDAARFVNWMENGQPTGSQVAGVTETGAYTLNGATSGVSISRNPGFNYGLPSESEWYKAAYHQPAGQGGDGDNYWLYPTSANGVPNSRNGSLSDPNSANFIRDDSIANGFNGGYAVNNSGSTPTGNALTSAGAYLLADSFYGTFDQAGNLAEWTDGISGGNRIYRGGSWGVLESQLRATARVGTFPTSESPFIGFRIMQVPEPAALSLASLGIACLFFRRKCSI